MTESEFRLLKQGQIVQWNFSPSAHIVGTVSRYMGSLDIVRIVVMVDTDHQGVIDTGELFDLEIHNAAKMEILK